MKIKTMVGAVALLTTVGINQAFAGFFPPIFTPPVVPEFDGSSAIAVIALLAGVAALIRARNKA